MIFIELFAFLSPGVITAEDERHRWAAPCLPFPLGLEEAAHVTARGGGGHLELESLSSLADS